MQGYATSEPYAIEQHAHFEPSAFLLANQSFNSYSTLIVVTDIIIFFVLSVLSHFALRHWHESGLRRER